MCARTQCDPAQADFLSFALSVCASRPAFMAGKAVCALCEEVSELEEVSNFVGTTLEWTRTALDDADIPICAEHAYLKIAQHAKELTPASEKITGNAMVALLSPLPLADFMDESDAINSLKYVVDKVVTRAAKRKADAVAAAAAEEARLMEMGTQRAAKRAAIASRPGPKMYWVDYALRKIVRS